MRRSVLERQQVARRLPLPPLESRWRSFAAGLAVIAVSVAAAYAVAWISKRF